MSETATKTQKLRQFFSPGDFWFSENTQQQLNICYLAERPFCKYDDAILTPCNSTDNLEWERPDIHSYQNVFKDIVDFDKDYSELFNSVQRHTLMIKIQNLMTKVPSLRTQFNEENLTFQWKHQVKIKSDMKNMFLKIVKRILKHWKEIKPGLIDQKFCTFRDGQTIVMWSW